MEPAEVFEDAVARVERMGWQAVVSPEVLGRAFSGAAYPLALRRIAEAIESQSTREWFASRDG